MVSVWDKLKEMYGSWKMLGTDVVPLLWAEGDRMQDEVKELKFELSCSSEALGKTFNKLADEQQKLDEIHEILNWYHGVSIREGHPPKMVKQILEVLGVLGMQEKKQQ